MGWAAHRDPVAAGSDPLRLDRDGKCLLDTQGGDQEKWRILVWPRAHVIENILLAQTSGYYPA